VQLAGRKAQDAEQAAQKIAALIRDRGATKTELLGPAPNPIPRLRGLYVFNLLVKTDNLERLQHLLEPARRSREGSVRVRIDVNPRNISELIED
jgi:primosomal protein N' (replication factor Y) (superfamily II helicase)